MGARSSGPRSRQFYRKKREDSSEVDSLANTQSGLLGEILASPTTCVNYKPN